MTELMSEPLGFVLGKSWGVNKHQKTGKEQRYSVSKNGRKRLISLPSNARKILKSTKSLRAMKENKAMRKSQMDFSTANALRTNSILFTNGLWAWIDRK